ncbi:MAG: hypothetical protein R6U64_00780 [Bacteroidales bacterium]
MKTKVIISAAILMLFTMMSFASSPKNVLTMKDALGRTLTMPVMTEEAVEDSLPFDLQDVFVQTRLEEVNTVIDISGMIKPEAEVDDVPSELKHLFKK